MRPIGLTRARSMGPVAEAVEKAGGSLRRVFARAELPVALVQHPDRIVPLSDALAVVENAAREIGDETLPVWLSAGAGVAWLGDYGSHGRAAPTLRDAIAVANALIGVALQSGTDMRLSIRDGVAYWTYCVTDGSRFGRQRNELLAFGYMMDLARAFAGPRWRPDRVVLPDPVNARSRIEQALGAEIVEGPTAALVFAADWLDAPNPSPLLAPALDPLPVPQDISGVATQLIRTSLLLQRRARAEWVAQRLKLSLRALQRRLAEEGASLQGLRNRVLFEEATALLRRGASATETAFELGYADPAHFSRAFRALAGVTPTAWRARRD